MHIAVFEFEVSNASSGAFETDKETQWYQKNQNKLDKVEDIEKVLDEFAVGKNIIHIVATPIDIEYHNNARGNTIHLIYTITYEFAE